VKGNFISHTAAYSDDIDSLMLLVENGINIYDCKNKAGHTPRDVAYMYNSEKVI
jgi:ankyrin repeat protein